MRVSLSFILIDLSPLHIWANLFTLPLPKPSQIFSLTSQSFKTPKISSISFHLPQNHKPPNRQTLNRLFFSFYQIWSTMTLKIGSKRKGNKPLREESPPHFDHSIYPLQESFNRYSTRTITFGRIINFAHLEFVGFNQLMRRMKWLTFSRMSNPSYPRLIRRFYANLSRPYRQRLNLVATMGDVRHTEDVRPIFYV